MEVLFSLKPHVLHFIAIDVFFAVAVAIAVLIFASVYPIYALYALAAGAGVLVILGLLIVLQVVRSKFTTYEVTETDLVWRKGIFAIDERVIPIHEITNMKIDRSIIGLLFGVANLYVDSASANVDYEIVLTDIDAAQLKQVVEYLRKISGHS
ncbi:Bacterial PH domain protein [uncultured archaeon]|nr:Bacterial PH domain protein [uncultured archaeon]